MDPLLLLKLLGLTVYSDTPTGEPNAQPTAGTAETVKPPESKTEETIPLNANPAIPPADPSVGGNLPLGNVPLGNEPVTWDHLKQINQLWVGQLTSIEQTIKALQDALVNAKTPSEKMEAAQRQVDAAQQIHEVQKANFKPSMLGGLGSVGGTSAKLGLDFLEKTITPGMPKDIAKAYVEKALGAETDDEALHEFQQYADYLKIVCGATGKRPDELEIWDEWDYFQQKTGLKNVLSVVDSPASWIPEGWSGELLTFYMQELILAQLWLPSFEMPQDPFRWDFLGTGITIYRRSEPTTDPASKFRSSKHSQSVITFATEELAGRLVVTRKLSEDALAAYVPELRNRLIPRAMAEALETAILNGHDTTAALHFDSVVVDDDDVKTAFLGLRRIAAAESAESDVQAGGSSFEYVDFNTVMLGAGQFAMKITEGYWIMSNAAYIKALAMDEVETMDKINLPTNVNGIINVIYGRPVLISPQYPQTMNSSGRDTGAGTLTGFLYCNRDQFKLAHRREDSIEQDRNIATGQMEIVITTRRDFQQMIPTGNTTVAAGINVPTT